MPFSGLSRPANKMRIFPVLLPGRDCVAKHGSANGYTTLIVETSTSRYPAHRAAAYRLVAIRVGSLVPSTANALCCSRMGGGLCRIRNAGYLVCTMCGSLTNTTVLSRSIRQTSPRLGYHRAGLVPLRQVVMGVTRI